MKKLLFSLLALAAMLPASADRYLTFGVNDTLRVYPSRLDSTQSVMVRAHFDGRLDQWFMTLNLPQGISLASYAKGDDLLNIPYENEVGEDCYCNAALYMNQSANGATVTLMSNITERGYWMFLGVYSFYGTVKWEPGDYDRMCELVFKFDGTLQDGATIVINEFLSSTFDGRGFTIGNTNVDKTIHLIVAYKPGDVDGDGKLSIADVTGLTDLLIYGDTSSSEDVMQAADVNGDAVIGIADVTALIDLLLSSDD